MPIAYCLLPIAYCLLPEWGRWGGGDGVGEEVEHGLDLLALGEDGFDGGLFEDLGADEFGRLNSVVGVLDLRKSLGGVGEFRLEGGGFGFDGVYAVADCAAAACDFLGGLLGKVLGEFRV